MAVSVKARYTSAFRDITGHGEEVIELRSPLVRDLIDHLVRRYGSKFKELVVDPQTGEISPRVGTFISVGGRRLEMDQRLAEGDVVEFLMALSGGSR